MKNRVSIFIDGSNFYHGATRILTDFQNKPAALPLRYDYLSLVRWLAGDRIIVSKKYYVGLLRRDPKHHDEQWEKNIRNQQRLFSWLDNQSFQVIRGHILRHPNNSLHEKGVDVRLALDILEGAYENMYDTVVLMSSDTDLIPAIDKIKKYNKKIEYVGFADKPSLGLTKYADISRLLTANDIIRYAPKRFFIVHRWDGSPDADWYPWLDKQLQKRGHSVIRVAMPNPSAPKINEWVSALANAVGVLDGKTVFIGHSIGCQTILRYLQTFRSSAQIGGTIFIAPWLTLHNLETDKERAVAKPWLTTPIDFSRIRAMSPRLFAVFSDDDPFVSLENRVAFEKNLGAETVVLRNKGHFTSEDGVIELPSVLDALQQIMNNE